MTIAGLVVVRLPSLNYLVAGRDRIPVINGIYYSGVERQRWADVFDEEFYSKRSPEGVWLLARALKDSSRDFSGIDVSQDEKVASKLLEYSNRNGIANELIALRSPELEAVKGTVTSDLSMDWMGYDFVAFGEWSLIEAGLFRHPEYYSGWLPKLNQYGLFDDPDLLADYGATYERAAAEGRSEPIAPKSAGLGILAIEVGRVR
jgi:hypothetical protein